MWWLMKKKGRQAEAQDTEFPAVPVEVTKLYIESQRDLVRSALRHLVHVHAVPKGCVASEVMVVAGRGKRVETVVELIVLKWNETLMACVQPFERELLLRLNRLDPGTNHSKFLIHWSFAPDCASPLSKMPAPEVWTQTGTTAGRKFDLPMSEKDFMKEDFAPTVPGPWR